MSTTMSLWVTDPENVGKILRMSEDQQVRNCIFGSADSDYSHLRWVKIGYALVEIQLAAKETAIKSHAVDAIRKLQDDVRGEMQGKLNRMEQAIGELLAVDFTPDAIDDILPDAFPPQHHDLKENAHVDLFPTDDVRTDGGSDDVSF